MVGDGALAIAVSVDFYVAEVARVSVGVGGGSVGLFVGVPVRAGGNAAVGGSGVGGFWDQLVGFTIYCKLQVRFFL